MTAFEERLYILTCLKLRQSVENLQRLGLSVHEAFYSIAEEVQDSVQALESAC